MDEAVILSACRTPVGTLLGDLSTVSAPDLGAVATREAVRRAGIAPETVDEVIMGTVLPAGMGGIPARQVALRAGLPPSVSALTINKMCGSGMKAVMLAAQAIRAGDCGVVVAGGIENMSQAPYLVSGGRGGWKLGDQTLVDSMMKDALICPIEGCRVGEQAEHIARTNDVSRAEQDEFSLSSQQRTAKAAAEGAFDAEIVPVEVVTRRGTHTVSKDQGPRPDSSLEALAKLRPAFDKQGTVTAGNASQISDGAASVVVASRRRADELGCKPRARIVAYATAGREAMDVFIAPVLAIRNVLAKAELTLADMDLVELNEAFAAQMLACIKQLNLSRENLNVHGGAIALGHPIGASGARVLTTLLYAMERRDVRRGLASLCLGGGNAVAMIVDRDV